jgi:hypothetical protein
VNLIEFFERGANAQRAADMGRSHVGANRLELLEQSGESQVAV